MPVNIIKSLAHSCPAEIRTDCHENDVNPSEFIEFERNEPEQGINPNERETSYASVVATTVISNAANEDSALAIPKVQRKRTTSTSIYELQASKKGRPRSGSINSSPSISPNQNSMGLKTKGKHLSGLKCENTTHHVFVGDIPGYCTEQMIKDALVKFGDVNSISIFRRSISGPNFGFVTFSEENSAIAAISEGSVHLNNESSKIRIERRKDFSNKHLDNLGSSNGPVSSPKKVLQQLSPYKSNFVAFTTPPRLIQARLQKEANKQERSQSIISPPIRSPDHSEIHKIKDGPFYERLYHFDWRTSAAKYLFRAMTMEDYLIKYICAQASYRQIQSENVSSLMDRLVSFSNSRPADINEMMPPSISGLVYNQTTDNNGHKFFNVYEIIKLSPSFKVMNNVIYYNNKLTYYESANELKDMLVEGLFIYFFAKFCHGPRFKIKQLYYHRSEPIKSTLTEITGHNSIPNALMAYFHMFHEIFTYDINTGDLTLTMDYFDKNHKEKMRGFLDLKSCSEYRNIHVYPDTTLKDDFQRSSESLGLKPTKHSDYLTPSNPCEFTSVINNDHCILKTLNQCKEEYKPQPTNNLIVSPSEAKYSPDMAVPTLQRNNIEPKHEVFETKQIFNDLKGTITSVSPSSGYIRFAIDSDYGYQDAYFIPDVLSFEGRQNSELSNIVNMPCNTNNLHQIVKEGYDVILDVEKQFSGHSIQFRALNVRIPKKNLDVSTDPARNVVDHVALDIDELLEPIEVLQRIKVDPIQIKDIRSIYDDNEKNKLENTANESTEDASKSCAVPEAVRSVVYGALREDEGHNILSNPWAIEALLNKLTGISMQQNDNCSSLMSMQSTDNENKRNLFPRLERDNLKVKIEKEVRKIVSEFVKEHQ